MHIRVKIANCIFFIINPLILEKLMNCILEAESEKAAKKTKTRWGGGGIHGAAGTAGETGPAVFIVCFFRKNDRRRHYLL
jgi:hypothetical protein